MLARGVEFRQGLEPKLLRVRVRGLKTALRLHGLGSEAILEALACSHRG